MRLRLINSALWKVAILVAGLCLLGVTATLRSTNEIAEHSRVLSILEAGKVANHDLNENVLRLRNLIMSSYDPLVRDMEALKNICDLMSSAPEFSVLRADSTLSAQQSYCHTVHEKIELTEQYKSRHSILRNSLKFLPSLVRGEAKGSHANRMHQLLAEVLLYNQAPSPEMEQEILSDLGKLEAHAVSPKDAELLRSFGLHVKIIMNQTVVRHELEQRILSSAFPQSSEWLETEYLSVYHRSQRWDAVYDYFLVLLSLGLAIGLFRSFQKLKAASLFVQELNIRLEEKVVKRTKELSLALSELATNQQVMAQNAKMTALGEMAGGIAHEINTPLGAILLNASSILEKVDGSDPAFLRKRVDAIIKIVDRISKIINGLKRFSRTSVVSEKTDNSVRTIVEDTLSLCSERLRRHSIKLEIVGLDEDLNFRCVPEQISQVLLNLLNNSVDALCEAIPEGQRWVKVEAKEAANQLEISVTDAGGGLSDTVAAKLMQPFFTTKKQGSGTGLGLSISRGIVEDHGGQLVYDKSSPHTRFVMRFPRTAVEKSEAVAA